MADDGRPITDLLRRLGQGDREGLDALVGLVYTTLLRMCESRLKKLPAGSLTPAALLNELYLDLADRFPVLGGRGQFFAYANRAIEHLAIDTFRRDGAQKRGGDRERVPIEKVDLPDEREGPEDLLLFFEVMARVEAQDPELATIVKLRVFDRLSERATAEELGITRKRVQKQWATARSLLAHLLSARRRTGDGSL